MNKVRPLILMARDMETGHIIRPDRAVRRPHKGRYQCLDPNCQRDVTVAISKYGRVHFKHFREFSSTDCVFSGKKPSRTLHNDAQQLLKLLLTAAIQHKAPMPTLVFNTLSGIKTVLPFILADEVLIEWPCPNTDRRPDLAVMHERKPVLLVEIYSTHAVDQTKQMDLSGHYWWIEVAAKDVLRNPWQLNVRSHGNLPYEFEISGQQEELFRPTEAR